MNFALEPYLVRCDRFKASGKWYDTFVIDMRDVYDDPIHTAVARAISKVTSITPDPDRVDLWRYVVLDPYHKNSYPIMMSDRQVAQEISRHG
jgi:hypothetical protein